METRVLKVLNDEDIRKVQDTVSSWRSGKEYNDVEGYCISSTTEEIKNKDYILTPGRYVGFANKEEDDVSFDNKIKYLLNTLKEQQEESKILDKKINLINNLFYE